RELLLVLKICEREPSEQTESVRGAERPRRRQNQASRSLGFVERAARLFQNLRRLRKTPTTTFGAPGGEATQKVSLQMCHVNSNLENFLFGLLAGPALLNLSLALSDFLFHHLNLVLFKICSFLIDLGFEDCPRGRDRLRTNVLNDFCKRVGVRLDIRLVFFRLAPFLQDAVARVALRPKLHHAFHVDDLLE